MKGFRDGLVLNRQIRIAIENEKFFAQFWQCAFDRAAGAEKFFTIEGIFQFHAERFVAEIALDHFSEIADAQNRAANSARVKHFKLMSEKRTTRNQHERFRNFFRDGAQPRGESARENRNGNFQRRAHEMTSFVPSKSKRKRTSFKPDCRITWRSFALSSA